VTEKKNGLYLIYESHGTHLFQSEALPPRSPGWCKICQGVRKVGIAARCRRTPILPVYRNLSRFLCLWGFGGCGNRAMGSPKGSIAQGARMRAFSLCGRRCPSSRLPGSSTLCGTVTKCRQTSLRCGHTEAWGAEHSGIAGSVRYLWPVFYFFPIWRVQKVEFFAAWTRFRSGRLKLLGAGRNGRHGDKSAVVEGCTDCRYDCDCDCEVHCESLGMSLVMIDR
jgi:hypothetical protein